MNIVLGSSSKWRKQIMDEIGKPFVVVSPDIDEKAIRHSDPAQLVLLLARAKNAAVQEKIVEPGIVVTSDQVIVWNKKIREKPTGPDQAREFLKSYAQHPAESYTAVVAVNTATGETRQDVDRARLYFSDVPDEVIDALIAKGDVLESAGGLYYRGSTVTALLFTT